MVILAGNNSVIHRLCGSSNECEVIGVHHTLDKSTLTCRSCNDTDLCNSTNRLSSDTHVIMFIIGVFALMLSNC